jgi:hypothetical protein
MVCKCMCTGYSPHLTLWHMKCDILESRHVQSFVVPKHCTCSLKLQQQGKMYRALAQVAHTVPECTGPALAVAVEGLAGTTLRHPQPTLVLYPPPATVISTQLGQLSYSTAASVQPEEPLPPGTARATATQAQAEALQPVQRGPVFSPAQIRQIRASIFGEPIRQGQRDGRKVLARPLQGPELASWYFFPPSMPGAHNEEAE